MRPPEFPRALPVTQTGRASWRLDLDGISQKVTNLDKPYWPATGDLPTLTKGDLLTYYFNIAEWILPFLADRALTLKRMPDGIDGDFFYAKQAPGHVPDWMPTAPVVSDDTGKTITYLLAQDTASLIYVANLGCVEMHPWHSRVDDLGHPDYAFFDLDPFAVPYRVVKDVALVIRAALDNLGLVGYPRTSGSSGLHIYVPIDRVHTFAEVRELVTRICRLINRADPARTTMEWQISDRTGKVFLDAGMNTEGRNIAAAYSLRPHSGAPVSTPLTWDELSGDVEPGDFTIATIWDRLEDVGDIFTPVLAGGQTLWAAMEAVGLDVERERRGPSHSIGLVAADQASESDSGAEEAGELDTYQRMRDFSRTAEPAGEVSPTGQARFVIQHHLATRLHHDLRLERGGTLRSWALPKGLPLVAGLPHLAMPTEDHPLEYLTFSGDIPAGEYGGGQMRIWDTGTFETLEWEDGKVTFVLHGHRHQGEWHLFRLNKPGGGRSGDRAWLVTRSAKDKIVLPPDPPAIKPALATGGGRPFDDDGWTFEVKWDGIRAIATIQRPGRGTKERNEGTTRLLSRNGNDISEAYPELGPLWERVLAHAAVLDGEVVALDPDGRPSFGLLQQRMHLRGRDRVDRARRATPVTFVVFDLLWVDGHSLVDLPLSKRLALLDDLLVPGGSIVRSDAITGQGRALYAAAEARGLEGVVAKKLTSRYPAGQRAPEWLKIKVRRTAELVIGGWAPGSGGLAGDLGSLAVGAWEGDSLRYVGRVGTGFTDTIRRDLLARLRPLHTEVSPFTDAEVEASADKPMTWVAPDLVAEVEFGELTGDVRLRAPSYRRLREDVEPSSCTMASLLDAAGAANDGAPT